MFIVLHIYITCIIAFLKWHLAVNMTELDRLSISTFDIIKATSGKGDKLEDNNVHTNDSKKIPQREYVSNQSFNHIKCPDQSWNVCYVTTLVILLFYLFLWVYFEQKEIRNSLKVHCGMKSNCLNSYLVNQWQFNNFSLISILVSWELL